MTRRRERPRDAFGALRDEYRARLPERAAEILESAARVQRAPDARVDLEQLRHLAHRLVGSAGLYGFARVSEAARELEVFAIARLDGASDARPLAALAEDLERACTEARSPAARGPAR